VSRVTAAQADVFGGICSRLTCRRKNDLNERSGAMELRQIFRLAFLLMILARNLQPLRLEFFNPYLSDLLSTGITEVIPVSFPVYRCNPDDASIIPMVTVSFASSHHSG
jgi:hypothetical protein